MSTPHHFKINEAFALGGAHGDIAGAAACTVRTLEKNTGLRIDDFLVMDFQGFKGMVNALDGVRVCPRRAIRDRKAHLKMAAGCQVVRGRTALAYVRARYSLGDGSDLNRISRQQEFMRALSARAREKLYRPRALYGFLDAATRSLTTDDRLAGIHPLYHLASSLRGIPADRLTFLTVPNYPRHLDVPTDTANVMWRYPQAGALFTALAADRPVDEASLRPDDPTDEPTEAAQARRVGGGPDPAGMSARPVSPTASATSRPLEARPPEARGTAAARNQARVRSGDPSSDQW
jgi:LCP family protein required for cell wall assembly